LETDKVILYGVIDDPSTWEVKNGGEYRLSGFQDKTIFGMEFNSYQECRTWVKKELITRRKKIGQCMDKWMKAKDTSAWF